MKNNFVPERQRNTRYFLVRPAVGEVVDREAAQLSSYFSASGFLSGVIVLNLLAGGFLSGSFRYCFFCFRPNRVPGYLAPDFPYQLGEPTCTKSKFSAPSAPYQLLLNMNTITGPLTPVPRTNSPQIPQIPQIPFKKNNTAVPDPKIFKMMYRVVRRISPEML